MCEDIKRFFIFWVIVASIMGFLLGGLVYGLINDSDINLSQKTADTICQKITGNETAIAKDWWDFKDNEPIDKGQLFCELPTYDSTHDIVIGTR